MEGKFKPGDKVKSSDEWNRLMHTFEPFECVVLEVRRAQCDGIIKVDAPIGWINELWLELVESCEIPENAYTEIVLEDRL